MLTQEQINQIRAKSNLPQQTNKQNYVGKYDHLLQPEKEGFLKNAIGDIKQTGVNLGETYKKTTSNIQNIANAELAGEQGKGRSFLQGVGAVAGGISSGIGNVFMGAVKTVLPQATEDKLKNTVTNAIQKAYPTAVKIDEALGRPIGSTVDAYNSMDDKSKRDVDALFGGSMLAFDLATLGFGKKVGEKVVREGVDVGADVVKKTANITTDTIEKSKQLISKSKLFKLNQALKKTLEEDATKAVLQSGKPNASIATKMLDNSGNVVKDINAKELVRQGLSEADVAMIKNSSPTDKAKMLEMLGIREAQLTDKTVTRRASDVAGDSFLLTLKDIQNVNKMAGKQLDGVAQKLSGKTVNIEKPLQQFSSDMSNGGIKIGENGTLDFSESIFRMNKPTQKQIQNFYREALKLSKNPDALAVHQTKKLIDEVVDYGKKSEGITGQTERLLKNFRHSLDEALDTNFPAYDAVNKTFSETAGQLKGVADVMGRKFNINSDFANASLGTKLRGLMSNNASRGQLMQVIQDAQTVARKYGSNSTDDLVVQANFANTLEKIFGTEAPTSLAGQVSQGISNVTSVASIGKDVANSNLISAGLKGVKLLYDKTRNIGEKQKLDALRKVLMEMKGNIPLPKTSPILKSRPILKDIPLKTKSQLSDIWKKANKK